MLTHPKVPTFHTRIVRFLRRIARLEPPDRVTPKKRRVQDADQALEPLDPDIAQALRRYRGY